ncbi:MAG: tetratricopeptide repeat protein [Candidatus Rokubacteria bacterium]|nr:tetratricopeptide repeat protein [Candidatus Rokubacteria bacterium]
MADGLARAIELWQEAYRHQMRGDLDRAIALYRESIAARPTAEAHTFLGWAFSFQGKLDEATQECLRAIEVDPDFGNPYNDIGVYLMQQDRLDEAIPWLEKAKRAPRYEPRQFPYMNMGRIFAKQGKTWDALREFEQAVRLAPTDKSAHRMLHEIRAKLN